MGFVKEKWGSYNVQGNNIFSFKDKLKLLKVDLKDWNKNVFGCLQLNQKLILKEIEVLDVKDDNEELEENGRLRRMDLLSQFRMVDNKLESLSRKKAKANWCKFGDMKSKFYHLAIRLSRLKNEVKGVEVEGQWCEEPEVVRREAKSLFEKRFTATQEIGVNLGSMEFKSLPSDTSIRMVTNFTEEEVKEVVWQCEGSKSSGPDEFNFTFIRNCWDFLKYDILKALHLFQETGIMPKGRNASFIALVPKVSDPLSLDQFRPISLVEIFYKIITKVLAVRMKEVLSLVIDENQYAFLSNKGMLDSVLMANEVVEEVRRNQRSALCFKVDYEKAYDSVRWNFLLDMLLHRLAFHSKWIRWVR